MDLIAEKAAEKAVEKVFDRFYREVGKGVVRRATYILGVLAVIAGLWLIGSGHINIK